MSLCFDCLITFIPFVSNYLSPSLEALVRYITMQFIVLSLILRLGNS